MNKEEFIKILKEHASKVDIFDGRFVCLSKDENHWKYERPALDILEPSINLSNEGFVLLSPNIGFGNDIVEKISYEEFITKYKLK